jgi:alkyl sulfatase BDS1-like metallo-beta-lactamase superfamily hydrolase
MDSISFLVLVLLMTLAPCGASAATASEPSHAKSKPASTHTIAKQKALRNTLPFDDRQDFEEHKRGFIAAPKFRRIMTETGAVAWDMGSYDYLLQGKEYDSIHPSLQRQAVLNMNYGLYEVVPGIYQVRGFDLANITFIQGDTGWIVFDPLTVKETARAALDFINKHLGERPVVAVVYSHSHMDHFGGVRGVVDEADVTSGKVQILAPKGFMKHAVAENIHAGNAMKRRSFYQYGVRLPRSPFGHVDQAIGKNIATGSLGLIAPSRYITKDIEEITIDGVRMVFQNTPGTEAPAEMNTYFPDKKAFWAAENIVATVHNIYTLRGALVRDALEWSKQINVALHRFGKFAEVLFTAHTWPRWGNARVQEIMRDQRDIYAHLNNHVLHLANQGVTINEIHNVYEPPSSLQKKWHARSYHGSTEHNSRAVINRYLGYWDANPATLIPLSPAESAPLYVEMMGGAQKILDKGQQLYDEGKYRLAQEILNKLVNAEPENRRARDLLADIFEQIGYQQESSSVRNSFLAAALELREGAPVGESPRMKGADMIKAMSTQMFLDYLAIRLDGRKVEDMAFAINLITPDNGEKYLMELSNSVLTSLAGYSDPEAALTITINRTDLEPVMMGTTTLDKQVESGKCILVGDSSVFKQLMAAMVVFTPDFEIMPGTRSHTPKKE